MAKRYGVIDFGLDDDEVQEETPAPRPVIDLGLDDEDEAPPPKKAMIDFDLDEPQEAQGATAYGTPDDQLAALQAAGAPQPGEQQAAPADLFDVPDAFAGAQGVDWQAAQRQTMNPQPLRQAGDAQADAVAAAAEYINPVVAALDTGARFGRTFVNEGGFTPFINNTPLGMLNTALEGQNPFSPSYVLDTYKQAGTAFTEGLKAEASALGKYAPGNAAVGAKQWVEDRGGEKLPDWARPAATEEDLYGLAHRQLLGNQAGETGNWWVDTAGKALIGIGTDPKSFLSFGTTAFGRQLANEGATALLTASKSGLKQASDDFLRATGVALTPERLANKGLATTLAEQVKHGEAGIRIGLPLMEKGGIEISGHLASKPLEFLSDISNTTREVIQSRSPSIFRALEGIKRPALMDFSESSGKAGLDVLGQFTSAKQFNVVEELSQRAKVAFDEMRAVGVSDQDAHMVEALIQARANPEHLQRVAKATGMSDDAVKAMFEARHKPGDVERAIREMGYNEQQLEALGKAADAVERTYQEARVVMQAAGKEVEPLGAGMVRRVEDAGKAMREYAGNDPAIRDRLAAEYTQAVENAATVPGYVFMRVSDEVIPMLTEAAKKDPSKARMMVDATGAVVTKAEANKLIQQLGTAALAGEHVKGRISWEALGKAFMTGFDPAKTDGVAKSISEAMRKGGEFFESHPGVALAEYVDYAAKQVGHAQYVKGVRAMGEAIPEDAAKLLRKKGEIEDFLKKAPADHPGRADLEAKAKFLQADYERAIGPHGLLAAQDKVLASRVFPELEGTAQDFVMPAPLMRAVVRQKDMMRSLDTFRVMGNMYGKAMREWKKITLGLPSSWQNNWIGGKFARLQGGGLDALSVVDDPKLVQLQRLLKQGTPDAVEKMKAMQFQVGPMGETMDGYSFLQRAKEAGGMDGGFMAHELRESTEEALGRHAGSKAAAVARGVYNTPQAIAAYIENTDKLGHMLARMRKGDTLEGAAVSANKFLFNYRQVSPFTNLVRSTGTMPFAAWSTKNIPLQLEMAFTRPGQFAALIHVKDAIESGVPGLDEDEIPDYVRKRFGVITERNEKTGEYSARLLEGSVPLADLPKLAPDELLGFMSETFGPVPKAVAETIFNKNLFRQKDLPAVDSLKFAGTDAEWVMGGREANAMRNLVPLLARQEALANRPEGAPPPSAEQAGLGGLLFSAARERKFSGPKTLEFKKAELARAMSEMKRGANNPRNTPGVRQRMLEEFDEMKKRMDRLNHKRPLLVP